MLKLVLDVCHAGLEEIWKIGACPQFLLLFFSLKLILQINLGLSQIFLFGDELQMDGAVASAVIEIDEDDLLPCSESEPSITERNCQ